MIPIFFFKKKHLFFYYSTTSNRSCSKVTYIRIIKLHLTAILSSASLSERQWDHQIHENVTPLIFIPYIE